MNYYQALEIKGKDGKGTGKYHFTRTNDGITFPVGYCADGCPGHDTPDEAADHYHQYLLDNARYDIGVHNYSPCEICGELTNKVATLGPGHMEVHNLCDKHRNREGLEKVSKRPETIASSY